MESKEFLGGFWIIEAANLDVALKLATEGSKACNRKVELRPFHVFRVAVTDVREAITQAHQDEWARVIAALTGVSVTSTLLRRRPPRPSRPPSAVADRRRTP